MLIIISLVALHVLAWAGVVHILLTKRDPRSALGWAGLILFVPALGLLLYILFGISRTESRASRIMRKQADVLHKYAHPLPLPQEPNIPIHLQQMARLGRSLTTHHLLPGNSIVPLYNGNEAYPEMLAAISRAERTVYLVTYIFNNGEVSAQFTEALIAAARRGVDVRVLLDGIGRLYSFRSPVKTLAENGVQTAYFLPPKLFPPNLFINLRNHRKIMVCDETAFTGGMNIADYHVVTEQTKHAAQDVHFKCKGPIVQEFYRAFFLDWGFANRHNKKTSMELPDIPALSLKHHGNCYCRLVLDGPGSGSDPLNELIAGSISNAMFSVTIMTPYFLPTREIMATLRIAAEKGVAVRIILPAKNNLPYVHWASYRVLPELLKAGVRVFFQPAPFAHTKLLCIDDYYCQIGSANLDSRSLRLNFELNSEAFDKDFNARMKEFCNNIAAKSREFTLDDMQAQNSFQQLRSAFFWLFSPYL